MKEMSEEEKEHAKRMLQHARRLRKLYIGDGVFADIDEAGRLVVTTEDGYSDDPGNRIVFEPEVWQNLMLYMGQHAYR
jgi:hypothetical protein